MKRWLLIAPLLLAPACAPPAARPPGGPVFAGESEAEAVCVVEEIPNYLLHLTALAGLPWPNPYAEAYGHTVDAEAAHVLQLHAPALQWGQGITGDLAPFFVLLPAYLPLEGEHELFGYLQALDLAMRDGDYRHVRDPYHDAHARLGSWLFDFEGFFYSRAEVYEGYLRAIRQLVSVYEHSFQAYHEQVWPEVEDELELIADGLNGELWSLDLIDTWEEMTQVRFRGDRYEVVLAAAPGGTGVTGLGYARSLVTPAGDRRSPPGPDRARGGDAPAPGALPGSGGARPGRRRAGLDDPRRLRRTRPALHAPDRARLRDRDRERRGDLRRHLPAAAGRGARGGSPPADGSGPRRIPRQHVVSPRRPPGAHGTRTGGDSEDPAPEP